MKEQNQTSNGVVEDGKAADDKFISQKIQEYERSVDTSFLHRLFSKYVLSVMFLVFTIWIRIRKAYHSFLFRMRELTSHPHRTPQLIERDVQILDRLPRHLSVILRADHQLGREGALEALIEDVADIACWSACAGIPLLSIYEPKGLLKGHLSSTHRTVSQRLHSYFGKSRPTLRVRSPHATSYANGDMVDDYNPTSTFVDLGLILISKEDGRDTLVDMAKTLAEMAVSNKLSSDEVNADVIDQELTEAVIPEPDLLLTFAPFLSLRGYPPWHLRLSEIL